MTKISESNNADAQLHNNTSSIDSGLVTPKFNSAKLMTEPATSSTTIKTTTTTTTTTTITQSSHASALWTGFYKKTIDERKDVLSLAFPHIPQPAFTGLDDAAADNMVENCIGTIGVPVGLGVNFTINGKSVVVPMAVEEPSVIAAVSGVAKLISSSSPLGFTTSHSERNTMVGQVQVLDIPDMAQAMLNIHNTKSELITLGNVFCKNMEKRGGGVLDVTCRTITLHPRPARSSSSSSTSSTKPLEPPKQCLIVEAHVDVCDSMGANCVTAVAEGISPLVSQLTKGRIGCRILSNLSTERMAKASFRIPVSQMAYKGYPGERVAELMLELFQWADNDPTRACTHNKGVMNGIDAVAIATGQDFRALEAAAHTYATRNGRYTPFTEYWLEEDGKYFCGEIELPTPVGVFGGPLKTNPAYQNALALLGNPTAKGLAMTIVTVGLCQNFAAMRALATEGIRRGHMALHARNIAVAAGAPTHAVHEVVAFMVATNRISTTAAAEYLKAHAIHAALFRSEQERQQLLYQQQLVTAGTAVSQPRSPPPVNSSDTLDNGTTAPLESDITISTSTTTTTTTTDTTTTDTTNIVPPSIFLYEEAASDSSAPSSSRMTFNVAFETLGDQPVYLEFDKDSDSGLTSALFGRKGHSWLSAIITSLDSLQVRSKDPPRANLHVIKRLKTLSILMNTLTRRLMLLNADSTHQVLSLVFGSKQKSILATLNEQQQQSHQQHQPHQPHQQEYQTPPPFVFHSDKNLNFNKTFQELSTSPMPHSFSFPDIQSTVTNNVFNNINNNNNNNNNTDSIASDALLERSTHLSTVKKIAKLRSAELRVGLPLLLSLWHVFEYHVQQACGGFTSELAKMILNEQLDVFSSIIRHLPSVSALDIFISNPIVTTTPTPTAATTTTTTTSTSSASSTYAPPASAISSFVLDNSIEMFKSYSNSSIAQRIRSKLGPVVFGHLCESLASFLSFHAKRFQVTMFLLCDAIAFHPSQLTPDLFSHLKRVGTYLEWEGNIVHDLARVERDTIDKVPNICSYWMDMCSCIVDKLSRNSESNGSSNSNMNNENTSSSSSSSNENDSNSAQEEEITKKSMLEFVAVIAIVCERQRNLLFKAGDISSTTTTAEPDQQEQSTKQSYKFDFTTIINAVEKIRSYYGLSHMFDKIQE